MAPYGEQTNITLKEKESKTNSLEIFNEEKSVILKITLQISFGLITTLIQTTSNKKQYAAF